MKTLLFALSTLLYVQTTAQSGTPPVTTWAKVYGGPSQDAGNFSTFTPDGGFIMCGNVFGSGGDVTVSKGNLDAWVVKISSSGSIEWQKSMGGSHNESLAKIVPTADGGYIAVGYSYSNDQDVSGHHGGTDKTDCWVVKMSSTGTIEWQKSLGGTNSDYGTDILPTTDGGYIMTASVMSTDGDITSSHGSYEGWLVKLSATGSIQWQKCFGGSNSENLQSVLQRPDGGYVLMGWAKSTDGDLAGITNKGGADYWLIKTDAAGTIQWQKTYGGTLDDIAYKLCAVSNTGFAIAGMSYSSDGDVITTYANANAWIVRVDDLGTVAWKYSCGGSANDGGFGITATADGGVVIAGNSYSNDGLMPAHYGTTATADAFVAKLTPAGTLQWIKNFGGSNDDGFSSVHQLPTGGYVATGQSISTDGDISMSHGGNEFFTIRLAAEALPVTFVSFNALREAGGNRLKWVTATEENTDRFVVERSADGVQFIQLGDVKAGAGKYDFIDVAPLAGRNHYRLKTMDKDGSYSYSNILMIVNDPAVSVRLFPNPATSTLRVRVQANAPEILQYSIVSADGKQVRTEHITVPAGISTNMIDVQHLPRGAYFLKIIRGDRSVQQFGFVK